MPPIPQVIVVSHCVAIDLGGMKMKKDVGEHSQRTAARLVVVFDTENGFVELGLFRILAAPSRPRRPFPLGP